MQLRRSAGFSLKYELIFMSLCAACAAILIGGVFASRAYGAESSSTGSTKATAPTNQITLDAVVADVLEHNPELNFYSAEIAATKGEAANRGDLDQSGSLHHNRWQTCYRRRSIGEGLAWSVSVRQTFEWPGRIPLRKAIANQQIQLAELGFAQFKAALAARTRSIAFSLFASQQKAAAAREVADRFHALREVLVQRDPAGITPELELASLKRRRSRCSARPARHQLRSRQRCSN